MSDVEFLEESVGNFKSATILGAPRVPKMVSVLVSSGVVKSEKTAGRILFGIVILCVLVSVYLLFVRPYLNGNKGEITNDDVAAFNAIFEEKQTK